LPVLHVTIKKNMEELEPRQKIDKNGKVFLQMKTLQAQWLLVKLVTSY